MAQILKEEVREKIVSAAKEEFLTKGFQAASMRRIAEKSEMTVGNLYRYFTGKDALNEYIVNPTLNQINLALMEITSNNISLTNPELKTNYTIDQFRRMLIEMVDKVGQIAYQRKIEFKILLMKTKVTDSIISWFTKIVEQIISAQYHLPNQNEKVVIISKSYAVAIIEGFKQLLLDCKDQLTFQQLSKVFMLSYLSMLENNLGKYLGE